MQTNDGAEAIIVNTHDFTSIALVIAVTRLAELTGKPKAELQSAIVSEAIAMRLNSTDEQFRCFVNQHFSIKGLMP